MQRSSFVSCRQLCGGGGIARHRQATGPRAWTKAFWFLPAFFIHIALRFMNARSLPNAKTVWLFVLGFSLGCAAWMRVFSLAFVAADAEVLPHALRWWFLGASVVSAVTAALQPSVRLFWNVGFAVPIFGWCLFCTSYAFDDTRFLSWTWLGIVTAVTALAGALVGQATGRRLT